LLLNPASKPKGATHRQKTKIVSRIKYISTRKVGMTAVTNPARNTSFSMIPLDHAPAEAAVPVPCPGAPSASAKPGEAIDLVRVQARLAEPPVRGDLHIPTNVNASRKVNDHDLRGHLPWLSMAPPNCRLHLRRKELRSQPVREPISVMPRRPLSGSTTRFFPAGRSGFDIEFADVTYTGCSR